jgi:hypothetical protein
MQKTFLMVLHVMMYTCTHGALLDRSVPLWWYHAVPLLVCVKGVKNVLRKLRLIIDVPRWSTPFRSCEPCWQSAGNSDGDVQKGIQNGESHYQDDTQENVEQSSRFNDTD